MKKTIFITLLLCCCLAICSGAFALNEEDFFTSFEELPAGLQSIFPDQYGEVQGIRADGNVYVLTRDTGHPKRLFIYSEEDGVFALDCESTHLPEIDGIAPAIQVTTQNTIDICYYGTLYATFAKDTSGIWMLQQINASPDFDMPMCDNLGGITFGPDNKPTLHPGTLPVSLTNPDPLTFPTTLDEAIGMLDNSDRAVVGLTDSNKRLNLRREPSKDASSLGQYYNGTPVTVLSVEDGWARVSICGIVGYMPNDSLRYGDSMAGIENTFPAFSVSTNAFKEGIPLYSKPSDTADIAAHLDSEHYAKQNVIVLGMVGDDWLHVTYTNDVSGYVKVGDLTD